MPENSPSDRLQNHPSDPNSSDLVIHSSDISDSVVVVKATSGGVSATTPFYLLGR